MSFNYYFAGATTERLRKYLVSINANVLKSYYMDKSTIDKFIEYKKSGWTGKLMIDNGEFSMHRHGGTINIDEYINWLNVNDEYIDYAISLDKIPGKWGFPHTRAEIDDASEITYQNYLYMRSKCKSPNKLLPVFHQEERLEVLRRLLKIDGLEYICLAGRKDLTPAIRKEFYKTAFDVIRNSNKPNIKVHCLGSGTLSDVEKFPFVSTDSTSCNMVAANGNIFVGSSVVYVGDGGKFLSDAERKIIESECSNAGITFDELINYQSRAIVNMCHMMNMSKIVTFADNNIRNRRLF